MIRLERSRLVDGDVGGLLFGEGGQVYAQLAEMQHRHLLVQGLGQHINLVVVIVRVVPQFDLRQHLVGEGHGHHEGTVTGGATQIHQSSFGQQNDRVAIGERELVHLRLDLDVLDAATLLQLLDLNLDVQVADVTDDSAVLHSIEVRTANGVLAGYPVTDVKIVLTDGSHHEVDSSEMAFNVAGSMAFKSAAQKAQMALLEPIMKLEVITPSEFLGDVLADLNSRRAQIQNMEGENETQVVNAFVPLAETFRYATDLRSRTTGRASFVMSLDHYDKAPRHIAEEVAGATN